MSRFVPNREHFPLDDDGDDTAPSLAKVTRQRSEDSLDTLIFLYQLLMALSITNAAYIFFTHGGSSYVLRPWTSYTPFDVAIFFAFNSLIIPFIHADSLLLRESYREGFKGSRLWPITDFFLLFLHAALFYMLSHSFAQIDTRPLDFFAITGAILTLNVFWSFLVFCFDKPSERRSALVYMTQNTLAVASGIVLWYTRAPHLTLWLVGILLLRNIVDFTLTYNALFPGAWRSADARKQGAAPRAAAKATARITAPNDPNSIW